MCNSSFDVKRLKMTFHLLILELEGVFSRLQAGVRLNGFHAGVLWWFIFTPIWGFRWIQMWSNLTCWSSGVSFFFSSLTCYNCHIILSRQYKKNQKERVNKSDILAAQHARGRMLFSASSHKTNKKKNVINKAAHCNALIYCPLSQFSSWVSHLLS